MVRNPNQISPLTWIELDENGFREGARYLITLFGYSVKILENRFFAESLPKRPIIGVQSLINYGLTDPFFSFPARE